MKDNYNSSLIKKLEKILIKQDYFIDPCLRKLGSDTTTYNTIPLMFFCCNNCQTFKASGIYQDGNNYIEFSTSIFRITKIKKEVLYLELLQLQTDSIIRTNVFISVNIKTFCGLECLEAVYAKKGIPIAGNGLVKVTTTEYITFSDGIKKVFTDADGYNDFNKILNPSNYSYANLFINGVLQPTSFYKVEEGRLELLTDDVPLIGSTIILQMIAINL